jgi:hypothetical protein
LQERAHAIPEEGLSIHEQDADAVHERG